MNASLKPGDLAMVIPHFEAPFFAGAVVEIHSLYAPGSKLDTVCGGFVLDETAALCRRGEHWLLTHPRNLMPLRGDPEQQQQWRRESQPA